jgi:hypothetical protein
MARILTFLSYLLGAAFLMLLGALGFGLFMYYVPLH